MGIRIRFVTTSSVLSFSIRKATNSLMSHAEFELPDGTWLGAHNPQGVAIFPADYMKPTWERRYEIPCTIEQEYRVLAAAHSQVGKPYDRLDILGLALHDRNIYDQKAWDCSALVCWCFEQGGIYLLNVDPSYVHLVTPEMLHLSPLLIGHCINRIG